MYVCSNDKKKHTKHEKKNKKTHTIKTNKTCNTQPLTQPESVLCHGVNVTCNYIRVYMCVCLCVATIYFKAWKKPIQRNQSFVSESVCICFGF